MRVAAWAAALLDLALPAGCLCCGSWVPGGAGAPLVCARCRACLPRAPFPRCPRCHYPRGTGRREEPDCRMCRDWPASLTRARHAFLLAPPADTLVHALKYEGWAELAPLMGEAMARMAASAPPVGGRQAVVPMPTTAERVRRRGYNQALLLARAVAERTGWGLAEPLVRSRGGATQVALHPSQRRANVKGAFAVKDDWPEDGLRGAHVLLVDDVLTTGATAGAAAAALAGAGVGEVTLLTYARAAPFLSGRR